MLSPSPPGNGRRGPARGWAGVSPGKVRSFFRGLVRRFLVVWVAASTAALAGETAGTLAQAVPASSPALEAAAGALAANRFEEAETGFNAVAGDMAVSPFLRALARSGLAEVVIARGDTAAARRQWEQIGADPGVPQGLRDRARRRLAESDPTRPVPGGFDARAHRAALPVPPEPVQVFHVAPDGDDAADGSAAHPFRTLERARDTIRAAREKRGGALPDGGVQVTVRGGRHSIDKTFRIEARDSGTAGSPIVYAAAAGAPVVLDGGLRVTGWRPVSDVEVQQKFDPAVRDQVREADLRALGLTDWGDPTALRDRPELFLDGVPQTLARWPNRGFVKTGPILGKETFKIWNTIEGCKDGRFRWVEARPAAWADEPDIRLYGYWFWDWYEEYQTVKALEVAERTFTLATPYSQYGYREGQRYYAVNVLRELDEPGEWYLDRRTGRIYWLPPAAADRAGAEIVLSRFDKPFIEMQDAAHVIVRGFTFENGRGDGLRVTGGSNVLIAGCTVRRFGGDGIVVQGGRQHGVFGCLLETLGCGATRVAGGDRSALAPGGHFVENCVVADISRLKRTYTPAVHLDGCGNRVAHNRFERMPSSALRVEGNDHVIELNHIRDVVQESDDQGGIDMFGNPLYRGVVIRWNRWSDIRGGTHNGAAGVRLDDMISGVTVQGNLFERCGAVIFGGVQIHGGKENLIDGNVFIDCFAGISFSRWGDGRWRGAVRPFLEAASKAPLSDRHPELAGLETNADVNWISRNVFARCASGVFLRHGGVSQAAWNAVLADPIDPGRLSDPAATRTDARLRTILLDPIPVTEIGPYAHPWCAPTAGAGSPGTP